MLFNTHLLNMRCVPSISLDVEASTLNKTKSLHFHGAYTIGGERSDYIKVWQEELQDTPSWRGWH